MLWCGSCVLQLPTASCRPGEHRCLRHGDPVHFYLDKHEEVCVLSTHMHICTLFPCVPFSAFPVQVWEVRHLD